MPGVALAAVCPDAGSGALQPAHAVMRDARKRTERFYSHAPYTTGMTVWPGIRIAYSLLI
jgi:hypothetical protein